MFTYVPGDGICFGDARKMRGAPPGHGWVTGIFRKSARSPADIRNKVRRIPTPGANPTIGTESTIMSELFQTVANGAAKFYRSEIYMGLKILVTAIAVGVLSALPLVLYIIFGPADGNPIGLGLLAVAGVGLAQIGAVIGVVWFVFEVVTRKR